MSGIELFTWYAERKYCTITVVRGQQYRMNERMNAFAETLEEMHWRDVEEAWRDAVPRPNDFELLQMFPDAVRWCRARLRVIKEKEAHESRVLESSYQSFLKEAVRSPDGKGWCPLCGGYRCDLRVSLDVGKKMVEIHSILQDSDDEPSRLSVPPGRSAAGRNFPVIGEKRRIEKLLRVDKMMRAPKGGDRITPEDVARAKAFPIENLIEVTRRDGFACCPFHGEKTPSMKVYRKENRWWCYGACATGGDVIDFVMRSESLEFIPAVRKLSGR